MVQKDKSVERFSFHSVYAPSLPGRDRLYPSRCFIHIKVFIFNGTFYKVTLFKANQLIQLSSFYERQPGSI